MDQTQKCVEASIRILTNKSPLRQDSEQMAVDQNEMEPENQEREGKLFQYWLTTTSTSTLTSITVTSTMFSVACTQSGSILCG